MNTNIDNFVVLSEDRYDLSNEHGRKCLSQNVAFKMITGLIVDDFSHFIEAGDMKVVRQVINKNGEDITFYALHCLRNELHPFDGPIEEYSGNNKDRLNKTRNAMFELGIVYLANDFSFYSTTHLANGRYESLLLDDSFSVIDTGIEIEIHGFYNQKCFHDYVSAFEFIQKTRLMVHNNIIECEREALKATKNLLSEFMLLN